MPFRNRVTELLGVEIPIVQAPMGWIARAQLASAVSNAGALGIIETSSGELDAVKDEIRRMRDLTDKPFGVNIAQAFVRDPGIVDFVDTVFLNRRHGPGLRALRTARSEQLEQATHNVMSEFGDRAKVMKLYFGGDLEAAIALSGQVAGRIDAVRPVAEVIRETAADCLGLLERLAARYPRAETHACS